MNDKYIEMIVRAARQCGLYADISPAERAVFDGDCIAYSGDDPGFPLRRSVGRRLDGSAVPKHAFMWEYSLPRCSTETLQDVVYTNEGLAWVSGQLVENACIWDLPRALRSRFTVARTDEGRRRLGSLIACLGLLRQPRNSETVRIDRASIIEGESKVFTYADWVLKILPACCRTLAGYPICLPKKLWQKSYVRRDVERLGLNTIFVDKPLRIDDCKLIRSIRPELYWKDSDVNAFREVFDISVGGPKLGSIVYLSRRGVESEAAAWGNQRVYPSDVVAEVVRELGGAVVNTAECSLDDFIALADRADIVVADHGAAMCNILFWNPRVVVELFTDQWWDDCFLFLSRAVGVHVHTLVCVDEQECVDLRERLRCVISEALA